MTRISRRQTLGLGFGAGFSLTMLGAGEEAQAAPANTTFSLLLVNDIYKMSDDKGRGGFAKLAAVVKQAHARQLLSPEHFTVDGMLIEAWAGLKSFTRHDAVPPAPDDPGNPTVDFHAERRSNATHVSTTDPEARLMRKEGRGREAKLSYHGHVLMENRHGLVVRRVRSAGDWDRRTRYGDEPHHWLSAPTCDDRR